MNWTSGIETWGVSPREPDIVEATELSRMTFKSQHVDVSRPIYIRNALRPWPAFERWTDPNYLSAVLQEDEFLVRTEPVMEMKWRGNIWPDRFRDRMDGQEFQRMSFDRLRTLASQNRFVFAYAVDEKDSPGLASLAKDVSDFPFLGRTPRPRYYAPLRYFLHGRSYTDWHYHPYDETLMCQFGIPKVVTLLPPTQETWDVLVAVAQEESYIGSAIAADHPALRSLEPMQITVRSGDAVYIPPHWWHAVECPDAADGLGVTLAYCWHSPAHVDLDPHQPFKRFMRTHGALRQKARLNIEAVRWAGARMLG